MRMTAYTCSAVALLSLFAIVKSKYMPETEGLRLMKEVGTLLFRSDTMTRNEPIGPQLICTGECSNNVVNQVVCTNYGINDMGAVVWQCDFRITGNIEIRQPKLACKGKTYSNQDYMIPGSCQITYEAAETASQWNFDRIAACFDVINTVAKLFRTGTSGGNLLAELEQPGSLETFQKLAKHSGQAVDAASSAWQCAYGKLSDDVHEMRAHLTAVLEYNEVCDASCLELTPKLMYNV